MTEFIFRLFDKLFGLFVDTNGLTGVPVKEPKNQKSD